MPGTGPKYFPCVLCNKRTKPRERRKITKPEIRFLQKHFFVSVKHEHDTLCNACRHKYYASDRKSTNSKSEIGADDNYCPTPKRPRSSNVLTSPPSVSLCIPSTSKSHSHCFLCKRPGPKMVVVPPNARFRVFLNCEIIIPAGSRCCPNHLDDGQFKTDVWSKIKANKTSWLNRSTILDLLKRLRTVALHNSSRIDFDLANLTESDYLNLTGICKDAFSELCASPKDVRNTPVRSTRTSLGIFLIKLKYGLSNKMLSTIFNISKSSLRRAIASVRQSLVCSFVPQNLGLQHISREEVIGKHTRSLAHTLFGSSRNTEAVLVLDGTYIYIQKSNNFQFQRRSYSLHKGRPLVKAMVVVTTTGYFLTTIGPYLADGKNNDAAILTHMFKTNVHDIKNWVREEDIFVLDRGFRDAISLLEDLGIRAEIPCFMKRGEKQLSTEDANLSRLVTKVRWIVESANARIKRWKYFDKVLPTNQVPYIGDLIRIVCAISNKFLPPLSGDREDDVAIASKMLYLSRQLNTLKERVETENLDMRKSTIWKEATTVVDFPRLSEERLRELTCGTYQLRLSKSYIQEHLDGNHDIFVHQEDPHLLKVKLQSRHVSAKSHLLWISYTEADITAWYCRCKTGARVVGVCAHIAAILWYLGYGRFMYSADERVDVRDWSSFVEDAANVPEEIYQSDSDESIVEE
ncbi:uncharacterized protein LOC125654892 [Ostrea edulis]|uniref:uncharacterized protein LOC125654892 n=1 Tax=Ostrea edulis TaxID=37623 RepID=UPI0024AFBD39|nr:uncharacterized protein LOC125654892 [Ostrea edulis]